MDCSSEQAPASSSFALRIGDDGSEAPPTPAQQSLAKTEAKVGALRSERQRAANRCSAATARATQLAAMAEEARTVADTTKDKAVKAAVEEAADAAEAEAAEAVSAQEEAQSALQAAEAALKRSVQQLRAEHNDLTAKALLDEARDMRGVYKDVRREAVSQMEEAQRDYIRIGMEVQRMERRQLRKEVAAEELALRDLVDPDFYRDLQTMIDRHPLHDREIKVGIGAQVFGDAPRIKGFPYPTHTPPLTRHQRLHKIAKYTAEDALVLDAHTERETAVHIRRTEMGDRALKPGPLGKMHEAVYLVHADSTTTTYARSKPVWVTETRLQKVDDVRKALVERSRPGAAKSTEAMRQGPPPFRGPGWARRVPANRTFETTRRMAMKELDQEVQREKQRERARLDALAAGEPPPPSDTAGGGGATGGRVSRSTKQTMRARAALHGLAHEIDGLPPPPPPKLSASPSFAPPSPAPPQLAARPQSAQPSTPRGARTRPPSASGRPDAGGLLGVGTSLLAGGQGGQPSPPKLLLHCLPSGQARPGSAVRACGSGRTPNRPSSAAAHLGTPRSLYAASKLRAAH